MAKMEYRIVLVGACFVGKTSVVNRFVRGHYEVDYIPTLEDNYRKSICVEGESCLLDIVDTSGDRIFSMLREKSVRTGDGFLCLFSVDSFTSFEEVTGFLKEISLIKFCKRTPTILVGNKCDMVERQVTQELAQGVADLNGIPYVETSAKQYIQVDHLFYSLVAMIRHQKHIKVKSEDDKCCKIC